MQAEARAVRLALSAFSAILPSTMDVWVDNTSLQGAANKGSSKSHAMTWELQRIFEFLDSRGIQATFAYVRSAENPADGISRGRVFTLQQLAKGSGGVLWLEESKVRHFVSNNMLILTECKGPCWWYTEFYILNENKTLRQLTEEPFFLTWLVSRDNFRIWPAAGRLFRPEMYFHASGSPGFNLLMRRRCVLRKRSRSRRKNWLLVRCISASRSGVGNCR
ncbi:hypothetical protein TCDM_13125 [Trypanosoma cruzi Dm28c]|uniref:Target of rapamycin (TOR) kinase 1 n=1 Tax=Trypanosoma cruzi Dm28c TaxID=1416333 RepID=V5A3Q3_TRYCR|nr:hypothetical protein TCDM_13125 [Trypanosoma cruzi Dm28c]